MRNRLSEKNKLVVQITTARGHCRFFVKDHGCFCTNEHFNMIVPKDLTFLVTTILKLLVKTIYEEKLIMEGNTFY